MRLVVRFIKLTSLLGLFKSSLILENQPTIVVVEVGYVRRTTRLLFILTYHNLSIQWGQNE